MQKLKVLKWASKVDKLCRATLTYHRAAILMLPSPSRSPARQIFRQRDDPPADTAAPRLLPTSANSLANSSVLTELMPDWHYLAKGS